MKQKWPILIFSALLTVFIVLVGIWGNAQFQRLPSGGVLTAQQAAKGIAPDGWRPPVSGISPSLPGRISHLSPSASPIRRHRWRANG